MKPERRYPEDLGMPDAKSLKAYGIEDVSGIEDLDELSGVQADCPAASRTATFAANRES
ncbi:MAG TPA: hypothetical protein VIN36_00775 [Thiobacillus sp.]